MTAEIAVMNSIGVALAADSAVTLGVGEGKIYTSADKLFHMVLGGAVGCMIYGSASLVEVPWETIIKTYRKQLCNDKREFNTLAEYADDLVRFLRENDRMFSRSLQRRRTQILIRELFKENRDEIAIKLREKEKSGRTISVNDIRETIDIVTKKYLAIIKKWDMPKSLEPNILTMLRKELRGTIAKIKKGVFQKLPMSAGSSRDITTMALEAIARCWMGSYESGIVVAGFGEEEYAPSIVEIKIDGMIEGRPKYSIEERKSINDKTRSTVVPFAQKEVVYTFMEGIDPFIEGKIYESTTLLFSGVAKAIIDKVKKKDSDFGNKLEKEANAGITKLLRELFGMWKSERKKSHWGPITNIVSSLPKDELAAMAEALVNLTKFKRRVSPEKETVGGPIDVAVITKGDGFVWVKRKHYFDPKLNPRAMGRYVKEA